MRPHSRCRICLPVWCMVVMTKEKVVRISTAQLIMPCLLVGLLKGASMSSCNGRTFTALHCRNLLLLAIVACVGLPWDVMANDLTKQVGAVSVARVERFLDLVAKCDTNALFDVDWEVQRELSNIRATSPQFLLERKLQAYSSQKKPLLLGGQQNKYEPLLMLLAHEARKSIVEIGSKDAEQVVAYVKFTFESPEKSPIVGNVFETMWSGEQQRARFLREIVLALQFTPHGLFQAVFPVPETTAYWDDLPFKIISAQVDGSSDDLTLRITTTGDRPVGKATVNIGDYVLEGEDISPDPKRFIVGFGYFRATGDDTVLARLKPSDLSVGATSNILVVMTLNSASGQKDYAYFTVPEFAGKSVYVRYPWNKPLERRGSFGVINDLSKDKIAEIEARVAAAKKIEDERKALLIGTWRDENSEATFRADGTMTVKYDNGRKRDFKWSLKGTMFTMGDYQGKVLEFSDSAYLIDFGSEKSHSTKVK